MKVTLPECAQDNSDNKQRMLCLKAHLTVNIMALNDTSYVKNFNGLHARS